MKRPRSGSFNAQEHARKRMMEFHERMFSPDANATHVQKPTTPKQINDDDIPMVQWKGNPKKKRNARSSSRNTINNSDTDEGLPLKIRVKSTTGQKKQNKQQENEEAMVVPAKSKLVQVPGKPMRAATIQIPVETKGLNTKVNGSYTNGVSVANQLKKSTAAKQGGKAAGQLGNTLCAHVSSEGTSSKASNGAPARTVTQNQLAQLENVLSLEDPLEQALESVQEKLARRERHKPKLIEVKKKPMAAKKNQQDRVESVMPNRSTTETIAPVTTTKQSAHKPISETEALSSHVIQPTILEEVVAVKTNATTSSMDDIESTQRVVVTQTITTQLDDGTVNTQEQVLRTSLEMESDKLPPANKQISSTQATAAPVRLPLTRSQKKHARKKKKRAMMANSVTKANLSVAASEIGSRINGNDVTCSIKDETMDANVTLPLPVSNQAVTIVEKVEKTECLTEVKPPEKLPILTAAPPSMHALSMAKANDVDTKEHESQADALGDESEYKEQSDSDDEVDQPDLRAYQKQLFSNLIDEAARERWELIEVGRLVRLFAAQWRHKKKKTARFLRRYCPELVSVDFLEGLQINLTAKQLVKILDRGSGSSTVLMNKLASAVENGHLSVQDPVFLNMLTDKMRYHSTNHEVLEFLLPLLESLSTVRDVGRLLNHICQYWQLERTVALVQQILLTHVFDDLDGNQDEILVDLPQLKGKLDFPSRMDQEDADENGNLIGLIADEDSDLGEEDPNSEDEVEEALGEIHSEDEIMHEDEHDEDGEEYLGETDSEEEREIQQRQHRPLKRSRFILDEAEEEEEDEEEESEVESDSGKSDSSSSSENEYEAE